MNRGLIEPPRPAGTPEPFPTTLPRRGDLAALPWYANYGNVVDLARYLAEQGEDARDVVAMLEKPWKFTTEYEWLRAAERVGR